MRLLYIGDPMCSWCWGFAPVLRRARDHYDVDLEIVVGGLRPGAAARPLDPVLRAHLEHHWTQVEQASGQPFNRATLQRSGWLYDTEPACRAVVAVRRRAPERLFEMFELFQGAFYRDAIDITDPKAIAELVAGAGLDPEGFIAEMHSDAVGEETYRDFALVRRFGVQGFPALLLFEGETLKLHLSGYRPFAPLAELFDRARVPLRDAVDR